MPVVVESRRKKLATIEQRWPKVQEILGALEEFDIHMVDVSPTNVAFAEVSGRAVDPL